MAQAYRRFGSRVTIVQEGSQLLEQEDADVAKAVTNILQQDGIKVLLRAKAIAVRVAMAAVAVVESVIAVSVMAAVWLTRVRVETMVAVAGVRVSRCSRRICRTSAA